MSVFVHILYTYIFLSSFRQPGVGLDYCLHGVCNHYGTIDGGHYTAFCRNSGGSSGPWYKYDDHEVYELSTQAVKTSAAYVLFYQSTAYGGRR